MHEPQVRLAAQERRQPVQSLARREDHDRVSTGRLLSGDAQGGYFGETAGEERDLVR
ncbi:hypothetical protein ACFYO9_26735 [Streptomyces sp. NPDC005863]|uniref:hypothetical protein n=1 Tax=unclassified Streptomyces TaxID=2593676 RepID=UPI00340182A7